MSDIQEQQASIAITLPDGTVKNVPSGSTGFDIALSIGKRLATMLLPLQSTANRRISTHRFSAMQI